MEKKRAGDLDFIALESKVGDVLVLGAGIAGIQASLDLANSGFKVYLVDQASAIGGKMAQLDKTFPTNDCSMCIESPKFIECERHPNIEIITFAEIDSVEGEVGYFTVTLTKKLRYIKEDKCRGCGLCHQYCPVKVPDSYNQNLSLTGCIHFHFPQAVPAASIINPEACLFLLDKKCHICIPICENRAIDFHQKVQKIKVQVGAIILAPGYDIFDPCLESLYGCGKMKNVITSLEFERILSASGPYQGEILRPSDGRPPKKMAWIQCVGSRQVIAGGNSYCSSICCMYAIKQVILAKEHDSRIEATIFHNDIRTFGKGFEEFYQRAKSLPGVRFIRSKVSLGERSSNGENIRIRYAFDESIVKEEAFDLVVLSVGLIPPSGLEKLADKFSIELNSQGFCKTNIYNPIETSRPGVFVGGAFRSPMDIPEAVTTASGAAALCGQLLSRRRGKLAHEKVFPHERDVSREKPRVGVFVCRCGTNIGRVVDVPSVVQYASTLSSVIHCEENLFSCSADAARQISETIKEKNLNRVVVAACTPRTHEPLFQDTLREAGINKYLFDMANIREHCSWVHSLEKEKATEKAKNIIRMSVARVVHLQPLEEFEVPINKKGLVVGGGLSGMISALSLAEQGFEVYLIEKNMTLGGIAQNIYYTLEGINVQAYLRDVIHRVHQNPLIRVFTNSIIIQTSGYVGNFITRAICEGKVEEIRHGIIIIATGAEEYEPTEYLYGKDDRVLTLLNLEKQIAKGDPKVIDAKSVVIILCVGCRQEDRPYCSRVCCAQSIKCALKLKEINPQMDIYIIYRDMRTYGFKEDYYRKAAEQAVKFIRYELDDKPQVEIVKDNSRSSLRITTSDPILEKKLMIDADILALGVAIIPSAQSKEISQLFKLPLNSDGFFLEAHVKLRSLDFSTEGVFFCGMAHYPKLISESISQAYGAAGRAATILARDTIRSSGSVCEVNEPECMACGACESVCYYGAIALQNTAEGSKARVIPLACKGCGACSAKCPTGAISLKHFGDSQIFSQIEAAFQSS
jgi:heterodisulfide reductase subunit A